MKYLKSFNENFLITEHVVGDMVYVNIYGEKTTGHGSKKRNLPFRPRQLSDENDSDTVMNFNFDPDSKYEIIHMDGYTATLYDDDNNVYGIDVDQLYDEKVITDDDYNFIKDCVISSFEDMPILMRGEYQLKIDEVEYLKYIDEVLINIQDITKSMVIEKEVFNGIFYSEFLPRLRDHGYESYVTYGPRAYQASYHYVSGVQICVTKKK